jgi:hypothetical protein
VQLLDSVYTRHTEATIWNDYQLLPFVGIGSPAPVYESLTPSVATVDENGVVSRVSDGVAVVRCTIGGVSKTKKFVFKQTIGGTSDIWAGFATDSLAYYFAQQIDSSLVGKSAATALRVFTTQNHASSVYVRNPSFWAADKVASLCAVSPWNSRGGATYAGVPITRRHHSHAAHLPLHAGDVLRWVLPDNSVIERTVIGAASANDGSDLRVATLSADLPTNIPPAKVLPENIKSYLPRVDFDRRIPAIFFDQEEKGLVHDITYPLTEVIGNTKPLIEKRIEFWEQIVGGDSGNIGGNWVGDNFVAFSTGFQSAGGSPSSARNAAINATIAAADANAGVSTGYTVTPADFSAFPTY